VAYPCNPSTQEDFNSSQCELHKTILTKKKKKILEKQKMGDTVVALFGKCNCIQAVEAVQEAGQ
jgi:hypothetical protein